MKKEIKFREVGKKEEVFFEWLFWFVSFVPVIVCFGLFLVTESWWFMLLVFVTSTIGITLNALTFQFFFSRSGYVRTKTILKILKNNPSELAYTYSTLYEGCVFHTFTLRNLSLHYCINSTDSRGDYWFAHNKETNENFICSAPTYDKHLSLGKYYYLKVQKLLLEAIPKDEFLNV